MTIRTATTMAGIPATLGEVLPTVFSYLSSQGIDPKGPPFVRYHGMEGQVDLEAGLPVADPIASPVAGDGRIQASELPGGEALSAWHVGPYDGLVETYRKMEAWMQAHNLRPAGAPWEVYWSDPGEVPDPSEWKTQILWPVAR